MVWSGAELACCSRSLHAEEVSNYTEEIADLAQLYGAIVVPGNWKTGIDGTVLSHFQAAYENVPYIEWLSPELWDSARPCGTWARFSTVAFSRSRPELGSEYR